VLGGVGSGVLGFWDYWVAGVFSGLEAWIGCCVSGFRVSEG